NDTTLNNPTFQNTGLLTTTSPAAFYRAQPALTLIRDDQATTFYDGYGVTVADINSWTDSSHPALQGHLTAGYDFVTAQGPTYALLNESSSSFLDESSSSFLDQSGGQPIDPATSAFLTESSSSFLDNGPLPLGLIGGSNVAYGHGTMVA